MFVASEIESLIAEMSQIQRDVQQYVAEFRNLELHFDAERLATVRNLLSYLALRQHDLRLLQPRLTQLGLSSLGRAEAHVQATLTAVLRALQALAGNQLECGALPGEIVDVETGPETLRQNTHALLGPASERTTRIMVTMPSEAADDPQLIRDLLDHGMDVMRINCAHDNAETWLRMIQHLRSAEQQLQRKCRICMDLAGPKLRTGPLAPLPGVRKIQPQRDAWGQVISCGRVFLRGIGHAEQPISNESELPLLSASWLAEIKGGDWISFRDSRGARRRLRVVEVTPEGVWAEAKRTCYFVAGIELCWHPANDLATEEVRIARVAPLPPMEATLVLYEGEELVLTRNLAPGRAEIRNEFGEIVTPARIGCTLPEVFDQVRVGDRIALDDGKLSGTITKCEPDALHVRLTRVHPSGGKLRSDKGINLPDTPLNVSPLTPKDLLDLQFVVEHAEIVAFSFASKAEDVRKLREAIAQLGRGTPAIVLKIETRRGFENLPSMLLEALRSSACGVMIARGDLAVECGFERLAEIQEEILWICEAAHVPVIWATQVLESLAKAGLPSRAEITDAAMGRRAECVMLNKGPQIVRALQTLDNILRRMQTHQSKKVSIMRELRLAHGLSRDLK